jgi:hypothetical protein
MQGVQLLIHLQKFEGGETTRHGYHLSVNQCRIIFHIDFVFVFSAVPIGGELGAIKQLEAKLRIDLTSGTTDVHEPSKL